MWISKKKYEEEKRKAEEDCRALIASADAVLADCDRLLSENMRLTTLVNGQTEDCKIGPWCNGCKYKGETYGDIHSITQITRGRWISVEEEIDRNKITICLKHVHEMCHEFESGENGGNT